MVHPYLRRRRGPRAGHLSERRRSKGVLERTLGVPIFQEQVMQLAIVAAGFTPGEADQLRRAMAAWKRRGGLEPFRAAAHRRHARARLRASSSRAQIYQPDPGLRRIRLSRIARGELRAAGVRLRVAQVPSARGVHLRAAQQPADGFLRARAAGARRARPRRRGAAGRRAAQRSGIARWNARRTASRRCGSASTG